MTIPSAARLSGFLIAAVFFLAPAVGAEEMPAPLNGTEDSGVGDAGSAPSGTELTVDVVVAGLDVTVANRVGERTHLGAGVGLGGNFLNVMLLGGKHFSQEGFLTYEDRDRWGGEGLFDVIDLNIFLRRKVSAQWRFDLGVQGSLLLHFDDSDDDPGGASFLGAYLAPYWGRRGFQIGPLIRMGIFAESGVREFGINLELVRGRFAFGGA